MYYTNLPETNVLGGVQRLNFRLPDFTKTIWASGEPRKYWKEKITKASNDWLEIEKLTIQEGIRDSILIYLHKRDVQETKKWCNRNGFELILLKPTPTGDSYSSYQINQSIDPNNYSFRAVITKKEFVGAWYDAWNGVTDNKKVGKLLGYPDCCSNFFEKYWIEEGWRDLTYPAYMNTLVDQQDIDETDPSYREKYGSAQGPDEINILGRWVGIRWVSHMPCSFKCKHSVEIAKQNREVARQMGYKESADIIDEVLSWSNRWSALHGIAEIKTPVYKISTSTDATGEELVIERKGTQPDIKASGKEFPFNNKRGRKYTDSKRFKKSLEAVYEVDLWEDNGFSSKEAMDDLHEPLIDIIDDVDSIIDLGSGNGALLQKLKIKTGASECKGIELNSEVVNRANQKFNTLDIEQGDIFEYEYDKKYDLTIFMPGRLTETIPEKRDHILNQILNNSKFLVLYMYSDWVERHENVNNIITSFVDDYKLVLLDERTDENVSVAKYQII